MYSPSLFASILYLAHVLQALPQSHTGESIESIVSIGVDESPPQTKAAHELVGRTPLQEQPAYQARTSAIGIDPLDLRIMYPLYHLSTTLPAGNASQTSMTATRASSSSSASISHTISSHIPTSVRASQNSSWTSGEVAVTRASNRLSSILPATISSITTLASQSKPTSASHITTVSNLTLASPSNVRPDVSISSSDIVATSDSSIFRLSIANSTSMAVSDRWPSISSLVPFSSPSATVASDTMTTSGTLLPMISSQPESIESSYTSFMASTSSSAEMIQSNSSTVTATPTLITSAVESQTGLPASLAFYNSSSTVNTTMNATLSATLAHGSVTLSLGSFPTDDSIAVTTAVQPSAVGLSLDSMPTEESQTE